MMKKQGLYQYQVFYRFNNINAYGYLYEVYDLENTPHRICGGDEWFDSHRRAELAAIGNITLLEKGA